MSNPKSTKIEKNNNTEWNVSKGDKENNKIYKNYK